MSKRGKSSRSHRCAVFLSVVLCAGLFTGCGDKKAVEISTGSTAAEKDVRDPYDGQSIDEQPNITETNTPPAEPHQASLENAAQENVDYSEAFGGLNGCAVVFDPQEQVCRFYNKTLCETAVSPCSTFKIVSTYAPALNEKGMTLATTFEDEPYEYPDGSPVNNATRSYNGTTTIRTAIQNSINVVAVKCLEKVTPELGLKYLDNFGFTTLAHGTEADKDANGNVWSDANLATALGGITRGVTNVELCASYAAIANGGNYIKPIYYTKILDHNGNVLIENTAAERSVIKESTAFLLTSAMEDVVKQGTGTACQLDNMPVAGKTGTTEAYNDLWFVGYTPYYTCAVWSGYDNNEKLPDYARNFHKALWKKVMTRIHEGLPSKEFEKPASVEKLSVCEETGLLPRAGCPVITEYFDVGTMPTEYCDQHFYDIDDYDYNYDTDSSDQTDNTTDTDNSENSDNGDTDNSGDSNNTDDNGNSGDDGTDNTGGSDDNGDGNEDDSSYQVDYY